MIALKPCETATESDRGSGQVRLKSSLAAAAVTRTTTSSRHVGAANEVYCR